MSDGKPEVRRLSRAAVLKLLSESFPGFSCLRCGNGGEFDVDGAASTFGTIASTLMAIESPLVGQGTFKVEAIEQYVDIVCKRCGFVERHRLFELESAEKPIKSSSDG